MDRIAAALLRDGVSSGDAVAICARTSINYGAAFLGILAAGAAVALLAPSSTPASLMMMLKDSGAKVFLLDRETAEILRGTGYEESIKRVALDDSDVATPFSGWLGPRALRLSRLRSHPSSRSTSFIRRARPALPKALFSPTACGGDRSPECPTRVR